MIYISPYNNISAFMAFRSDSERAMYEDVHDFNKNWFDRATNPEFKDYEQNILAFAQEMHNKYFEWGHLTVDSSEAIYCSLLTHMLRFKEDRGLNSHSPSGCKLNFVISDMGHIAFKKAAILLGVEHRVVSTLSSGELDINDLQKKIDDNTFVVIALAGTTILGNYDDITAIDAICVENKVPLHLDAAIGGFIYPFRRNSKIPDFQGRLSIMSANISGHKYGYSRPSVGILLYKNKNVLPQTLYSSAVPYLLGNGTDEYGLLGTKSPIGLIDLNFNISSWKTEGYQQIVDRTFKQKQRIVDGLSYFKQLQIIDSGDTPIFLIAGAEMLLNKLSKAFEEKGLYGAVNRLYDNQPSIRVVVRKHFDDEYVGLLLESVDNALATKGAH